MSALFQLPDARRTGHDLRLGQFGGHRTAGAAQQHSSRRPRGSMLGAGFLAVRAQVDVAEEFGKRVRA